MTIPEKIYTSAVFSALTFIAFSITPPAFSDYRCRDDGFGGQRCWGDINGIDINTRTRSDGFGGSRTTGTIGGEDFSQRCSTNFGTTRCW